MVLLPIERKRQMNKKKKKSKGVVPNGVKEQMKVAALLVGAIRTAIMIDDFGEITPEEIGLATEALRKELDDLRHVAGLVR